MCLFERGSGVLALDNIATRSSAIEAVAGHFRQALDAGKHLFAGFDFAFGYPRGAATIMAGDASWSAVWERLSRLIKDQENNVSNRFEIGGQLNQVFQKSTGEAPFWGHPHQHEGRYRGLQARKPIYKSVLEQRLIDQKITSAQPVWKLAYTGSVGSQTLLGIPRLETLRKMFGRDLQVWPFETQFSDNLRAPIVVAEVYPSLLSVDVNEGEEKDAAQVRTAAKTFSHIDSEDGFGALLARPDCLDDKQCEVVITEESWMVGAGHDLARVT